MPIFGANQFDKLVEKATNESNIAEDWQSILECCDYINAQQTRPIEFLRSILKRMSHNHPNVSIQAVILLDACVSNCGKKFHLEVASREFITEARKLLAKGHPKVIERFKIVVKKWSENEFKSDPELNVIPAFVFQLREEGYDFTDPSKPQLPKDPNIVISDQEEEDIIKALELSLKDIKSSNKPPTSSSIASSQATTSTVANMYPDIQSNVADDKSSRDNPGAVSTNIANSNQRDPFKVRALYDFEAAESNELTFKAGEIIMVTDDRDENWWSGTNHRGEGLFPANFITRNLEAPLDSTINPIKNVQFDEQVRVKFLEEEVNEVDESKIDKLLRLLHDSDPTGSTTDSNELIMLEEQCFKMGKLVDKELERLDRIQVALNNTNRQLTEAMREYLYLNQ